MTPGDFPQQCYTPAPTDFRSVRIDCTECGVLYHFPGPGHVCRGNGKPPEPEWLNDGETAAKVFGRIIGAADNGVMSHFIRYKTIQKLMEHGLAERQCLPTCDSKLPDYLVLACNCEGEWV